MFRSMNQFAFVRLDLVSYLIKYTTNIHVILIWHVNVYSSSFLYG
jgi:hypothetical protein